AAGRPAHDLSSRRCLPAAGRRHRHRGRLHHRLESSWLQPRADLGAAVLRSGVRWLAHRDRAAAADHRGAHGARRGACGRPTLGGGPVVDLMSLISIVIGIVLWLLVGTLAFTAAMRSKALFREGAYEGA